MTYVVGDAFAASKGVSYTDQMRQNLLDLNVKLYVPEDTALVDQTRAALKVTRDANGRLISAYSVNPADPYDAKLIEQDYQGALEIAEQRLKLDPLNLDFMFDRAYALGLLGNHSEALRHYKNLLELDPDNGAALNNAANALASMGRGEEALVYYKQALRVDGHDVTASLNLAEEYRAQGNYQMCYNQIDATLKMSPSSAEGQLYLAELKQEQAAIVRQDFTAGAPDGYRLH
jgi:tetratricopeptide (TPR) repeat protein